MKQGLGQLMLCALFSEKYGASVIHVSILCTNRCHTEDFFVVLYLTPAVLAF